MKTLHNKRVISVTFVLSHTVCYINVWNVKDKSLESNWLEFAYDRRMCHSTETT